MCAFPVLQELIAPTTRLAVLSVLLASFAMVKPTLIGLPFLKSMEVRFALEVTIAPPVLTSLKNVPLALSTQSRASVTFRGAACASKTHSMRSTGRQGANRAANLPLPSKDLQFARAMARIGVTRSRMHPVAA